MISVNMQQILLNLVIISFCQIQSLNQLEKNIKIEISEV